MSANIGLTLASNKFEIAGGESADINFIVRNQSQIVDHYVITVEGLEPTWWSLSIPTFSLFPNDQGEARIAIHPAKEAEAKAGGYSFRIKATSKADPMDFTTVEALLILRGFLSWEVDMSPTKVVGKIGTYRIVAHNSGNADAVITLDAKDPEEGLIYQFDNNTITVPAGGSTKVKLTVKPKKGEPQKLYSFQVFCRPSIEPKGASRDVKMLNGQLEYPKRKFPWWIILLIVLLLAAAAAAWFLFLAPSVTVTSPKGGENWTNTLKYNVNWTTKGIGITAVKIEFSRNNGATWQVLSPNEANDGLYQWTISTSASTQCYIRISGLGANGKSIAEDKNEHAFTISLPTVKPTVTLISPAPGAKLKQGDKVTVTWTASGTGLALYDLHYSLDGGKAWTEIYKNQPYTASASWTVPSTSSTNCFIRVTIKDTNKAELASDPNDSAFTIEKGGFFFFNPDLIKVIPFSK